MEQFEYQLLVEKLSRKITCLIMEELSNSYRSNQEYENFERDYEFVRNLAFMRVLRDNKPSDSAKALSPAVAPYGSHVLGVNFN